MQTAESTGAATGNAAAVTASVDKFAHKPTQEVFIPVHGFVWLSRAELAIVDHPLFQRLRRIKQLGMAQMVYPGATHSRYEHVLGVLHMTQKIIDAVQINWDRAQDGQRLDDDNESAKWGKPITPQEVRLIRLCALLHDIGHLPYGHSLEDELGLLSAHDGEDRLRRVIDAPGCAPLDSESLRDRIWRYYREGGLTLRSLAIELDPIDLAISVIIHGPTRDLRDRYKRLVAERDSKGSGDLLSEDSIARAYDEDLAAIGVRLPMCADIVGNTICADLLDYLHRDWHHVGKSRHFEDRALQYMEVRRDPSISFSSAAFDTVHPGDRFVVNLGRYPRLRTDAISLILELLESRYNLAEAVLFHRTKLKLTGMLERCLSLTFRQPASPEALEGKLLAMSEDAFLDELCREKPSFQTGELTDAERHQRWYLANCIRDRRIYQHVHTIPFAEGRPEAILRFQQLYSEGHNASANRETALRQIEADFGLQTGDVVMYSPRAKMNSKIAEVKVLVGGELHRLDRFDEVSPHKLAGGHLSAQLERFRNLWLVTFLVDPRVADRLGLTSDQFRAWRRLLADYIQAFVIGSSQGKEITRARSDIAAQVVAHELWLKPHKGLGDLTASSEPLRAAARTQEDPFRAKAQANGAKGMYPNGASSVWYYVRPADAV
jgi:HD superfamily phosphohydrolase